MIRINLLPSSKKPLMLPPTLMYGIAAVVILMVVLIGGGLYIGKQLSALQAEITAKEQKMKELQAALVEVKNYERDNNEFREKTMIIERLKKNQIVPLRLLDEVSEMLPKGVWLNDLQDKGGLVSIEGYAFSNSDLVSYVQNLKGSEYLTNVMLVESRQAVLGEISIYKFKLTFRVQV